MPQMPMTPPLAAPPGVAPGAPAAAAAQLLALLSRPETMQALLALMLASQGRATVPVGTQQVPPAAFANAIAELASVAALDDTPAGRDAAEHLFDDVGRPRGDLANPAERAAILLADLASVAAAEMREDLRDEMGVETDEALDGAEVWGESWAAVAEDDPVDAYEAAISGRSHV
jgi:hypothetical protein